MALRRKNELEKYSRCGKSRGLGEWATGTSAPGQGREERALSSALFSPHGLTEAGSWPPLGRTRGGCT